MERLLQTVVTIVVVRHSASSPLYYSWRDCQKQQLLQLLLDLVRPHLYTGLGEIVRNSSYYSCCQTQCVLIIILLLERLLQTVVTIVVVRLSASSSLYCSWRDCQKQQLLQLLLDLVRPHHYTALGEIVRNSSYYSCCQTQSVLIIILLLERLLETVVTIVVVRHSPSSSLYCSWRDCQKQQLLQLLLDLVRPHHYTARGETVRNNSYYSCCQTQCVLIFILLLERLLETVVTIVVVRLSPSSSLYCFWRDCQKQQLLYLLLDLVRPHHYTALGEIVRNSSYYSCCQTQCVLIIILLLERLLETVVTMVVVRVNASSSLYCFWTDCCQTQCVLIIILLLERLLETVVTVLLQLLLDLVRPHHYTGLGEIARNSSYYSCCQTQCVLIIKLLLERLLETVVTIVVVRHSASSSLYCSWRDCQKQQLLQLLLDLVRPHHYTALGEIVRNSSYSVTIVVVRLSASSLLYCSWRDCQKQQLLQLLLDLVRPHHYTALGEIARNSSYSVTIVVVRLSASSLLYCSWRDCQKQQLLQLLLDLVRPHH